MWSIKYRLEKEYLLDNNEIQKLGKEYFDESGCLYITKLTDLYKDIFLDDFKMKKNHNLVKDHIFYTVTEK